MPTVKYFACWGVKAHIFHGACCSAYLRFIQTEASRARSHLQALAIPWCAYIEWPAPGTYSSKKHLSSRRPLCSPPVRLGLFELAFAVASRPHRPFPTKLDRKPVQFPRPKGRRWPCEVEGQLGRETLLQWLPKHRSHRPTLEIRAAATIDAHSCHQAREEEVPARQSGGVQPNF